MTRHCIVIYHNHRKSLWYSERDFEAQHLVSFLLTIGADFTYHPKAAA